MHCSLQDLLIHCFAGILQDLDLLYTNMPRMQNVRFERFMEGIVIFFVYLSVVLVI